MNTCIIYFFRRTIFYSLEFSFSEFKISLIMILRVKHDQLGSSFYGPSENQANGITGESQRAPGSRKLLVQSLC